MIRADVVALRTLARLLLEAQGAACERGDLEAARWCVREWADAAIAVAEAEGVRIGALW